MAKGLKYVCLQRQSLTRDVLVRAPKLRYLPREKSADNRPRITSNSYEKDADNPPNIVMNLLREIY